MKFFLSFISFITLSAWAQEPIPLTVDYITTHMSEVSPECVKTLLKLHPEEVVSIHRAAMACINYEDAMVTTESTPEETAANGGRVIKITSPAIRIPVQYERIISIINETFAYQEVVEEWLNALNSDDCYRNEDWFRNLIITQAADEKDSPLLKTICSIIDSKGALFDTLLETSQNQRKSFLDTLYELADTNVQRILKAKTRDALKQKTDIPTSLGFNEETLSLISSSGYPLWACALDQKNITQTEAHMFDNPEALGIWQATDKTVRELYYKVHAFEQQERLKGNYIFYHAQTWHYHLYADIYKQLWNIAKNDTVGDDFTFTRFDEQKEAPDKRTDCLWMNHALYGNAYNHGDCTAYYFYANRSIAVQDDLIQSLFVQFGMSPYYEKYKDKIIELEQLHTQANENTKVGSKFIANGEIQSYSGCGNLLLISIPAQEMHRVNIVWPGAGELRQVPMADGNFIDDAKKAIDTLLVDASSFAKPHPELPAYLKGSDFLVYTLPLTTDYALDPHTGPRIYEFNAADSEKLKKYMAARDALFAHIKQDLALIF
jgi:hypothetical protein